ncbi:uncharacterized protein LOC132200364 [Neocloeon triangulifer]|uniref:uncharacterized protein LOC132200364 n=1 Tax=Neocloeon triangulifer TaxID=2078957 RepID=UPI00286EF892|nr:uncharacterized protein LOC132200364 [Neocloeon triangulifer]
MPSFAGIVLFTVAVTFAAADKCPPISSMANFNASEMTGVWYDIAHTHRRTGLKLKCDLVKFTSDPTSPTRLDFNSFSYSSATKSTVSVAGKIVPPTKKSVPDGTLAVTIPTLNIEKAELKVLSTDYRSFAVFYACQESENGTAMPTALILTREQTPSSKLKHAAFKVLENINFPKKSLRETIHTSCHSYDLASKVEQQASTLGHATSMAGVVLLSKEDHHSTGFSSTAKPKGLVDKLQNIKLF